MIPIIKLRKIWFIFSATLVILSWGFFLVWGLNLGIDFTGGSLLELEFLTARPGSEEVREALKDIDLGNVLVQAVGEKGMILRFKEVGEEDHQKIIKTIKEKFQPKVELEMGEGITAKPEFKIFEEKRFDSIGPVIGQELKSKTILAIIIAIIAIILYIGWSFRKISKPVASWKYGVAAAIALFHDVSITIGIFVILGKFYNWEIGAPFIAALLTILGYSINDTIVVFDRTRENLARYHEVEDFEGIVEKSINQTLVRSISTSMTVILTLVAIFFFGGQSIKDFTLALIVGIFFGTYSSIFLASPLLVVWEKLKKKV